MRMYKGERILSTEEFNYYSFVANEVFKYMNGKINTINWRNTFLSIDYHDYRKTNIFSYYLYPHEIKLHLGYILDNSYVYFGKLDNDSIVTQIVLCIVHELFHADQNIDLMGYIINDEYRTMIETITEEQTYGFMVNNRRMIEKIFNFTYNFTLDKAPGVLINNLIKNNGKYVPDKLYELKSTMEDYYRNIVEDIVGAARNTDDINIIEVYKYRNVFVTVILKDSSYINSACIKQNGEWVSDVSSFTNLIYDNMSRFSYVDYDIRLRECDNGNTLSIDFIIVPSRRFVYPLIVD